MDFMTCESLSQLTPSEIKRIPKRLLTSMFPRQIDSVYTHLSKRLKLDPEIQGYLFCYKHSNLVEKYTDTYDGPIFTRNKCQTCINIRENEQRQLNCNGTQAEKDATVDHS